MLKMNPSATTVTLAEFHATATLLVCCTYKSDLVPFEQLGRTAVAVCAYDNMAKLLHTTIEDNKWYTIQRPALMKKNVFLPSDHANSLKIGPLTVIMEAVNESHQLDDEAEVFIRLNDLQHATGGMIISNYKICVFSFYF